MQKWTMIWLAALLVAGSALAQPPAVEWSQVYGGAGFESMWNLIPVPGGRYLIVGETTTYGAGSDDWWIVMVDAVGNTIWTKTYGGPLRDICTYATSTSDGGFVGVGYTESAPGNFDAWLIKLNSNGDSLWSRRLDHELYELYYWVEQTSDGGYIAAGSSDDGANNDYKAWAVKLDGGGAVQWENYYGGAQTDEFISVTASGDGGFVFSGYSASYNVGADYDAWLLKTDNAGNEVWSQVYGTTDYEVVFAVSRTIDNGYFTTGYTAPESYATAQWLAIKTDEFGNAEWVRAYGDPSVSSSSWQGEQLADGTYIVGGYYQYSDSGGADLAATRLDTNGDSLWTLRFYGDGTDYGWFAYTTPDGGFLLGADTYSSWSAGDADWLVVKTESVCDDQSPQTPIVVIDNVGSNVVLHWPPVVESVTGCQIEATHYLVFYSPAALMPYYYHGYTTDTLYTHLGVIAYAPGQYYYVIASTAPIPTLQMPSPDEHATLEQVLDVLQRESPESSMIRITPTTHTPSEKIQNARIQTPLERLHRLR